MISANEIKKVRSLSEKKFRDRLGLFCVEGEKMVNEAVHSRFDVEVVYHRDEIGDEAMSKISALSSPSPVLAVVRKPKDINIVSELDLSSTLCKSGLYLALDAIRDPGNLGTILRIADWFGIDAVFAAPDTVDVFNPKVVQATMGAIFRVRFHYTDIPTLCHAAICGGGNVYGTFLDGADIYTRDLNLGVDSPSVIVIGNESNGISAKVASLVSDRLYIPPYPRNDTGSESLNAAIATAITISEFRRRV